MNNIVPMRSGTLTEIAQTISRRTAGFPITVRELSRMFGLSERMIKQVVQRLRESGLPIGANRQRPYGYWWISTPQEMETFVRQYRAQALNELRILSRMVGQNYPSLVGQLRLPLEDEQL